MTGAKEPNMFVPSQKHHYERSEELEYWLRRAEQESIAAIRSTDRVAAQRHDAIAQAYSALATSILAERATN
jgi:hypothetical protein